MPIITQALCGAWRKCKKNHTVSVYLNQEINELPAPYKGENNRVGSKSRVSPLTFPFNTALNFRVLVNDNKNVLFHSIVFYSILANT